MTALAQDRMIKRKDGEQFSFPVAAAKTIFTGALVGLDASGNAWPADAANIQVVAGVALERADNADGLAGAINVEVSNRGIFNFKDGGTITAGYIGYPCFIVDDQTVTQVDNGYQAGIVMDVDASGVWVKIIPTANIDT